VTHLLEVRGLTAAVNRNGKFLKVLDDINFSVYEGEIMALLGESGCGKSLTALSIAGLLPTAVKILSGEIIYSNQNLVTLNEKRLNRIRGSEITMIFQETRQSLNPLLKAGRQITESLELSVINKEQIKNRKEQKTRNKELALEMLETLGFEQAQKIFDSYPHQLSGGMCQRVMTAIAAITKPRLLLADEPSSSADDESREKILSLLLDMNRKFKTSVLVISHDLSVIGRYCSRFIIMYAGKIVEEGPLEMQELRSPLHPYTKALINAIPGKDKRGKPLENISGKIPSIEDRFSGCPFAPRCPKAQNVCKETFPPVRSIDNRKVFCYFPEL